jgi:hypothetical protein
MSVTARTVLRVKPHDSELRRIDTNLLFPVASRMDRMNAQKLCLINSFKLTLAIFSKHLRK